MFDDKLYLWFTLLQVHHCPLPCSITTAYPFTDSGAYWCESGLGAASSPINISVTGRLEHCQI